MNYDFKNIVRLTKKTTVQHQSVIGSVSAIEITTTIQEVENKKWLQHGGTTVFLAIVLDHTLYASVMSGLRIVVNFVNANDCGDILRMEHDYNLRRDENINKEDKGARVTFL